MNELNLFSVGQRPERPLADRLRPNRLSEIVGQISSESWLAHLYDSNELCNLLLHGPPGVGKTTLARCLFQNTGAHWQELSAVSSTLKDLKPILKSGRAQFQSTGKPMGLFIDEIHRFNTAQQDALLPYLEEGSTILVGATTENPSFSVNRALRSRMRLFTLNQLTTSELVTILKRAWASDALESSREKLSESEVDFEWIARAAQGDGRRALSLLEFALKSGVELTESGLSELHTGPTLHYDKKGDAHYEYASALIKSMRANDERDAAYWLIRFVDGGGDPRFVFRRLAIFASEDIGNAQPEALQMIDSAARLFDRIGRPEGDYLLMQSVIYLARAAKSREVVQALAQTRRTVLNDPDRPVPAHLLPKGH